MALDPITAGIGLVDRFVDKFIPDKDLGTKLKAQARSEEFQGDIALLTGQLEVNKVEAAHDSIFVAGWRPFIGWCCGIGLLFNVLLVPFFDIWYEMPVVNTELLERILIGMLGLGVLRTYEKAKGVSREK